MLSARHTRYICFDIGAENETGQHYRKQMTSRISRWRTLKARSKCSAQ